MPYTLMKGLVWVLLAVLLGVVIGWLLRSVAAKRQVERARAANLGTAERDELDRLRQRVADLETTGDDHAELTGDVVATTDGDGVTTPAQQPTSTPAPVSKPEPSSSSRSAVTPDVVETTAGPDLVAASAAIGGRIVADDLTVVEGIGPKIAELCHGIGIRTWSDLAETEVSLLRTMLNDAGQRFKAHDPGTWPQQATLLAAGAWEEFVALTDRLDGGRPVG